MTMLLITSVLSAPADRKIKTSALRRLVEDASGSEDETFAARAVKHKGQLQKGSSGAALRSCSSSPAKLKSATAEAKSADSNLSDAEEESPAPAMLKSRKSLNNAAAVNASTSRESRAALRSNSEISDGWVIRCKCGITDDDGAPMTECDGGCKTWVHDACLGLEQGDAFWCDACKENVQSSKPTSANPAAMASNCSDDSGVSQATPCAVQSNTDVSDVGQAAQDAATAAAAPSRKPVSNVDGSTSDSATVTDSGKMASNGNSSRANAAKCIGASPNRLDDADMNIDLTDMSPPKSATALRSSARKVMPARLSCAFGSHAPDLLHIAPYMSTVHVQSCLDMQLLCSASICFARKQMSAFWKRQYNLVHITTLYTDRQTLLVSPCFFMLSQCCLSLAS